MTDTTEHITSTTDRRADCTCGWVWTRLGVLDRTDTERLAEAHQIAQTLPWEPWRQPSWTDEWAWSRSAGFHGWDIMQISDTQNPRGVASAVANRGAGPERYPLTGWDSIERVIIGVLDGPHSPDPFEPVGLAEIADLLGVARKTVDSWRGRGQLPESRWTVGGRPAWDWSDIQQWARETGLGKPGRA